MSADSSSKKVNVELYQELVGAFQFVRKFRPDISYSGMVFGGSHDYRIRIVSDSDHGNCPDTGRSTSGLAVFIGDSLIIHKSKLQHITTLSAAEAELVALVLAICEARWVRAMLWELVRARGRIWAYTDCMDVVHMANQQKHLQRTRHHNINRHFLHDEVSEDRLSVEHTPGKFNFAVDFTKPQNRVLF
ncbi:unnamed protein product, partial [Heterosigma akashiwo]